MDYLHGEYDCKIDAKGRLRLPSQLLKQLRVDGSGDEVVLYVNRGFEDCLMLYPELVWNGIVQNVSKLNIYKKREREFVRYFFRGVCKVESDTADRILISKSLMDYAEVGKEVVLFAYLDRIELWAKDKYAEMLDREPGDFAELAEQVFGWQQGDE